MEFLNLIEPDQFRKFLMILMRVSVVLYLFPFFGSNVYPTLAKTGLALILTFLLFPVTVIDLSYFPGSLAETVVLLVSEILIGLGIGLSLNIFLGAAQLAGQLIGFQMGFSMINVIDPQSGTNVSIMEQIARWVMLLVFLVLDGHHSLILALADSFRIVHVGMFVLKPGLVESLVEMSGHMFVTGLKIGAPVIAALLFTSVAFGITGKFAPSMNIMMVAFPLKIFVGLMMFGTTLQIIAYTVRQFLPGYREVLVSLLARMAGG